MKKFYKMRQDIKDDIVCKYSSAVDKTERYHSHIEIHYALTDGITAKINGEEFELFLDTFVIADSFDVQSYDGKGEVLYLSIPDRYYESYKKLKGQRRLKQNYFTTKSQTLLIKSILTQIYEASQKSNNFLQMEGLIKYLLGTILSFTELIEEKSVGSNDTVKQLLLFINNNFNRDLTLDYISSSLGYNKHYISHVLSKTLSTSLNDYINGLRVDYFINNVDNTENISETAFKSGFQSLATFYRAFEKVHGCSPKKYLKNIHYNTNSL